MPPLLAIMAALLLKVHGQNTEGTVTKRSRDGDKSLKGRADDLILSALPRTLGNYSKTLATGATARPTRTSWVPAGMILTLVHSTRLLPWVVKITPNP